jgi:hypothetical protein
MENFDCYEFSPKPEVNSTHVFAWVKVFCGTREGQIRIATRLIMQLDAINAILVGLELWNGDSVAFLVKSDDG